MPRPLLLAMLLALTGAVQPADPPVPPAVADAAKLVEVYAADRFFEGPTWDPKTQKLYFTSFGKDTQILRLDEPGKASVWMDRTEGVNGTYLANDGRLLGAQATGHRVVSYGIGDKGPTDPKVLYHDKKLFQPNDLCQAPNGNIYFTDPDFKDRKGSAVYLLTPEGKATRIITDMPLPNGIKTAMDGKTLYVSDSYLKLWRSYPIKADGLVGEGKVFFDPDTRDRAKEKEPDGLCLDEAGNLYFAGRGGIWVVNPEGKALGFIPVPEFCSNVTFGGKDGKTLYLTCSKKVYSLEMKVAGALFKK